MALRLTSSIEVKAPIETVFDTLERPWVWLGQAPGPWSVEGISLAGRPAVAHRLDLGPAGVIDFDARTVRARRPDLVSWAVSVDLAGTVVWELDDLDELTFVRGSWTVSPCSPRLWLLGPARLAVVSRAHGAAVRQLAAALAAAAGGRLVRASAGAAKGDRSARVRRAAVVVA